MPYIPDEDRPRVEESGPINDGELAYLLYAYAVRYLKSNRSSMKFEDRNAVAGVIYSVHGEFRRRFVDEYEDTKREQNGDVL